MIQRTGASFFRLKEAVAQDRFTSLWAQTRTRTLCLARLDGEDVYFILNRPRRTIITVLTRQQAMSQLGGRHAEGNKEDGSA
jgi:hypothetical protein